MAGLLNELVADLRGLLKGWKYVPGRVDMHPLRYGYAEDKGKWFFYFVDKNGVMFRHDRANMEACLEELYLVLTEERACLLGK